MNVQSKTQGNSRKCLLYYKLFDLYSEIQFTTHRTVSKEYDKESSKRHLENDLEKLGVSYVSPKFLWERAIPSSIYLPKLLCSLIGWAPILLASTQARRLPGLQLDCRASNQGVSGVERTSSFRFDFDQDSRKMAFPVWLQIVFSGLSSMRRVLSTPKSAHPLLRGKTALERVFKKSSCLYLGGLARSCRG